jgi:hypothetical protein
MTPKDRHWRMEIVWDDCAQLADTWDEVSHFLKDRKRRTRVHSAGFVLADDKFGLVIASSVHGSRAAGVTFIPRAQIVKRKRLR